VVAAPGSVATLPLRIDGLAGQAVDSLQFDVTYNTSVIVPSRIAASISGTISEGLSVVSNSPEPGRLKVVVYGAVPVGGDGVYVNLRFHVVGDVAASTPVDIHGFRLNDGTSQVGTRCGRLTVKRGIGPGITGTAMDSFGRPTGGVNITLISSTGESVTVAADESGHFKFGGLVVGETYTISIGWTRHRFLARSISIVGKVTNVEMIAEP
jgi:hypothetical protein